MSKCGLCGRRIKKTDVVDTIGKTVVHWYCKHTANWRKKVGKE